MSGSESIEPDKAKNIYQDFIQDYYAKRGHYKVAPDIPKEKKEEILRQREGQNQRVLTMPVLPKEDETGDSMTRTKCLVVASSNSNMT